MLHRGQLSLIALLATAALLLVAVRPGPPPGWEQQLAAVRQGQSDTIHLVHESIDDRQLAELAGLPGLRQLKLERGSVTASGLAVLGDVPDLEVLLLRRCRLGNGAIRQIVRNRQLRTLNLPQAEFGDEGLEEIAALPELVHLRFSSPYVSAPGMEALGHASQLRYLQVFEVPVTERFFREVAKLPRLESLYIDHPHGNPAAIDAGLAAFFAARPDVHVHLDQHHHDLDPHTHPHGSHDHHYGETE
jgi:hypothetical protein